MRYRIKPRLAELGLKHDDIIAELRKIGIYCTDSQFSRAINGKDYTKKSETICEKADEIISGIERERGIK